jgi:hypothetical protein
MVAPIIIKQIIKTIKAKIIKYFWKDELTVLINLIVKKIIAIINIRKNNFIKRVNVRLKVIAAIIK